MRKLKILFITLFSLCACSPVNKLDTNSLIELQEDGYLIVNFIDVGQGDSTLINCNDHYMLIDGGPGSASNTLYAILSRLNISQLDYIVATHPHSDHIGGLSGALQVADVNMVLSPVVQYESSYFAEFLNVLQDKNVEITVPQVNDAYTLGGCEFTILSVDSSNEDVNNTSIVLQLDYGNTIFMFPGDAERDIEKQLVDNQKVDKVNVLKMSHHGSSDAIYNEFIASLNPDFSIISCASENEYGHPHVETVDMLKQMDTVVLRTDVGGDIKCISDGSCVACNYTSEVSFDTNITSYSNSEDCKEYEYATSNVDLDELKEYIGNTNSKIYHDVNCEYLPSKDNQVTFNSAREAQDAGYSPHYSCVNNKEEN